MDISVNVNDNYSINPSTRTSIIWLRIEGSESDDNISEKEKVVPKQVLVQNVQGRLAHLDLLSIGITRKREPNEDHLPPDYPFSCNLSYPSYGVKVF